MVGRPGTQWVPLDLVGGRVAGSSRALRLVEGARRAPRIGSEDAFGEYLRRLLEQYRRRPTLIEILDQAGLG